MLNLNLTDVIDDAKCYETVRQMRWKEQACCPKCSTPVVIKRGKDETQPDRQRYQCKDCGVNFDDLTGTIFAGHHQPLGVWILWLDLMGLNLSNRQIGQKLNLNEDDVHKMSGGWRQPPLRLSGEVEYDEVYVTAGHKGNPQAVKKKDALGEVAASKGFGVGVRSKKKNHQFSG